jgi:hypothetical protein
LGRQYGYGFAQGSAGKALDLSRFDVEAVRLLLAWLAERAISISARMETHTLRALVRIMARKVGVLFGGVCQPCFGLEQGLGRLRRPARVARRRSVREIPASRAGASERRGRPQYSIKR